MTSLRVKNAEDYINPLYMEAFEAYSNDIYLVIISLRSSLERILVLAVLIPVVTLGPFKNIFRRKNPDRTTKDLPQELNEGLIPKHKLGCLKNMLCQLFKKFNVFQSTDFNIPFLIYSFNV
ncbi:hypothetical protein RF11_11380 [Thelohanellus kitauei]|uniref:Uncharacterized protein n=1 Tax=Thelohanellus kitauei TaxID=669202 RepID=A0A0C2JA73_THEKT|nr:hypothetical protein RF11_11380 [Thelohanellus kitauei]